MRSKYIWLVSLFAMLTVVLAACGGTQPAVEEAAEQVEEAAAEVEEAVESAVEEAVEEAAEEAEAGTSGAMGVDIEPVRIAIVMPSSTTDLAWSQSIYDALLSIQEAAGEGVVEISFTEGMFNVTDAAAALRDYAADGNNIVIAHGTQYGSSMFEIAPDFPDTSFVWGTATDTGEGEGLNNIFAYEARAEEGGFVNGVLAAALSESGVIGVVGPVEAGDAKLYIDGFVAGAEAANPDATINVSYTGSFGDTALAAEAANVHIDAGADVLTGSAQQVVGAIGVAQEQGVPWMGTQSDQSPLAPDIVVATQLYHWNDILLDIITKHQGGELGGTAYALTLENGGLQMIYGSDLPADAVALAQMAETNIVAGADPMAGEVVLDGAMAEAGTSGAMGVDIEPVRIAIVMPSSTTDLAWSQSIYDALLSIQEAAGEGVVEISFTEGMFNVTDAAAALRDYAADGNNIVIAHGTQYGSSMFEIAPDFPDTSFVWGTATDTGEGEGLNNIFAYEARAEEGGFVNGVLAAALSESGVIGVVGPVEAGDAKLYIDGFVAGAEAANPDATINVSYTGSFGDTALAAEAANVHIDAGADVLTGSAQQVVGAIGVAQEQGVPWMGTQSDQSPLAPDIVVATQLYHWNDILLDIITKHQGGELGGTAYALTLENGGLQMIYGSDLPADAVALAQMAETNIAAGGEITTGAALLDEMMGRGRGGRLMMMRP